MTISSTANRVAYNGNGGVTAFGFPYAFQDQEELVVLETVIATGVQTAKTLTTDYTISGTTDGQGFYPGGGTVTMLTAPASGVRLTIYRDPVATQETDLVENDPLPAETLESAYDKAVMLIQRLRDIVTRSLRQPDGDSSDIAVLPAAVARASKLLAFDANGDPEPVAAADVDLTPVSPFVATLLDDADAATFRTSIGAGATGDAIFTAATAAAVLDLLDVAPNSARAQKDDNTGAYTVIASDLFKTVNIGGASPVVTLPEGSTLFDGFTVTIKSDTTDVVTINRSGSDTVDGTTSHTLGRQEAVTLVSDGGTTWRIGARAYRPMFKVGSFAIDMTAASATDTVTGVGFRPRAVIVFGGVSLSTLWSVGVADGVSNGVLQGRHGVSAGTIGANTTQLYNLIESTGNQQAGVLASLTADGFTITRTKTGTPSAGSANMTYVAFR